MVSSLPFLAPVFLRKAKEYRSKQSGGSSNGQSRRLGGKGTGDHYKLSDVSSGKHGRFNSSRNTDKSGSEENILQGNIIKSVTYSVQVDDGDIEARGATQRHARGPGEA